MKEDVEYVDVDPGGHPLARLRLGRPALPRLRLLRPALRVGGEADPGRQGVRLRPGSGGGARLPRHAHRSRGGTARPGTARVEENLDLFRRMRAGEFAEGARTLRAKIDMASPNMNLRDPIMYRIIKATHHRTGDTWCIYPSYDWAHGQSDALEGITHSLCSQEYEIHRPLYDWFLDQLDLPRRPRQIEFARLNLTYTVMSKRLLLQLVKERLRQRLGRPADADPLRDAAARLHAGGDPGVHGEDRPGQARQHRRPGAARALRARGPEPAAPRASWGCCGR